MARLLELSSSYLGGLTALLAHLLPWPLRTGLHAISYSAPDAFSASIAILAGFPSAYRTDPHFYRTGANSAFDLSFPTSLGL